MVRKKAGRSKGARTKGYFHRPNRGWFSIRAGKFVPLTDADGNRLRDSNIEDKVLREAYARHLLEKRELIVASADALVGEVAAAYLDHLRAQAGDVSNSRPTGLAKTYVDRGQTLFDFCYGLPGEFFCNGNKEKRKAKGDPEEKRIHAGYGSTPCSELGPAEIDAWLKAHKWTKGGWRTRVQAVKRAFNFGVERKMIDASPIRGYKVPKATSRVTYLTPEQEAAMIEAASPAFALALKVCIRTGARFGIEFAKLKPHHVRDHGNRMEWAFKPEESKTNKQRIIRIADPEIIQLVRDRTKTCKRGETIFRNATGKAWSRSMLSQNFRRAKAKIQKKRVLLDEDACMYSCRHTYAKRTLEGYWSGKPASIKTLARLMGNTVQVCIDHYLQFSEADNEMLWDCA